MGVIATFMLVLGLATLSSCLSRQYYFINAPKAWTDARRYCRENYTDLATVENENDQNRLIDTITATYSSGGQVWTGLYEDVLNSWRWYLDDDAFYREGERDYRNWAAREPDNLGGNEMCTVMLMDGSWNDLQCNNFRNFSCYDGVNNRTVVIGVSMNASDARQYYREYYTDLASIRNTSENEELHILAGGQEVWIGLYRTWLWSDKSNFTYGNWNTREPNNLGGQEHCGAVWLYYSGRWNDSPCYMEYPFVCYAVTPTTISAVTTTTPEPGITTMRNTAPIPEYVVGARVSLISNRNLTQSEIENTLKNVLIRVNHTSALTVRVTRVETISGV